jgi:type IV pilus assembly protein PilB
MISTSDISQTSGKKAGIRFGELLLSKGLLNRRELTEALNEQRSRGGRIGEIIVKLKMVSDEDVNCALAEHLATERVHLDGKDIDMNVARLVPEALAKRFNLVAIDEKDGKILVAMADPLDIVATDTITMKTGREIHRSFRPRHYLHLSSHRRLRRKATFPPRRQSSRPSHRRNQSGRRQSNPRPRPPPMPIVYPP